MDTTKFKPNNKLSLHIEGLKDENKVEYAELLNNVANSTLETIYVTGIEQKEVKASEAFQTSISYGNDSIEVSFNPKNHFFYKELNKINNVDKLLEIAEIDFGFFSKIAFKSFSKLSSEIESGILAKSREKAAENLIRKNLNSIISMLEICLYIGSLENSKKMEAANQNPAKPKMR